MFTVLFGAVSLLYATVGQAGGTAFLALMAFASFPANEMRPTALLLNIVAAIYSTWVFNRGKLVDWAKLKPLLIASLPTAFIGGFIVLDEHIYKIVTGLVLLSAAIILVFRRSRDGEPDRQTPLWGAVTVGAMVGFVSGLTGVGGGVYRANPDCLSVGISQTNRGTVRAIYFGEFVGRSGRGLDHRTGAVPGDLGLRNCDFGWRHSRHDHRAALADASRNALRTCDNPGNGGVATLVLLTLLPIAPKFNVVASDC
jgi:hypothetical protein